MSSISRFPQTVRRRFACRERRRRYFAPEVIPCDSLIASVLGAICGIGGKQIIYRDFCNPKVVKVFTWREEYLCDFNRIAVSWENSTINCLFVICFLIK